MKIYITSLTIIIDYQKISKLCRIYYNDYCKRGLFVKKWYKNTFNQKKLSDKDKISLIGRLHDLLTHGFTISEAFHFIIKQYNIPEQYKAELLAYIAEGATCNQLL